MDEMPWQIIERFCQAESVRLEEPTRGMMRTCNALSSLLNGKYKHLFLLFAENNRNSIQI
jgi:hypothetical protein